MTPQEFVGKAFQDKKYLTEIAGNIPDDLLAMQARTDKNATPEQNNIAMGSFYAKLYGAAAQNMGLGFGEEEIRDECIARVSKMGVFKTISYATRLAKALDKHGKKMG